MITIVLLSALLVFVSVVLLGVRIFFTKDGKFPDTHVGRNKKMKEKGIHCAQTQDRMERNKKNLLEIINHIEQI